MLMQALADDPAQARLRVAAALLHMQVNFSYKNVGRLQAERLSIVLKSRQMLRKTG